MVAVRDLGAMLLERASDFHLLRQSNRTGGPENTFVDLEPGRIKLAYEYTYKQPRLALRMPLHVRVGTPPFQTRSPALYFLCSSGDRLGVTGYAT